MIALLRQRNYGLLWSSQLISQIGNWALLAALPFFVFQLTGSVLATGIMFIVQVIPPILLGSVAGVFVDRWDRRWTMIGANVARGLLLLLLLTFRSAEQVWVVYLVAFLESVANLFFGPANNALLPQLVGEDELVSANSLDALGENVARILGPALGGVLLATVGLTAVALIDAGTYLIGAGLIFLIQSPELTMAESQIAEHDRSFRTEWLAFWRDWIGGLRLVSQRRPLSYAFIATGIALIGDSIMGVLLVVFVQDVVGVGAQEFGWILTARGIGGVLGGLIIARVGPRFQPKNLIAYGMVGVGVVLIIMIQFPVLPVVLAAGVLVGLPVMAWMIAGQTWLQVSAEDRYRGRVFGAFETYSAFMGLIGIGFATLSGESLGVLFSLYVASLLLISGGMLAYLLLRPRFLKAGVVEG
jgi:predicted MFS family arabinose efflux permease